MSEEAPVTRWLAAVAWIGLVLFLGWQEFFVENEFRWIMPWWFRIPVTLMIGLALLLNSLECVLQEMTVRRWAVSLVVFAGFGLSFIAVGIFDPDVVQLSRWFLIPLGVIYLGAAAVAGIGARDNS
ncbi:MAG TPA: hypothetical protein VE981_23460 [Planctomycetota bacterium]|nr:hypothetical protein [Planctomycetota bacterium]